MGDENPVRTLGDYSKPSREGYKNTIELLSEDLNKHLKDFLKLVNSLDLDGDNKERTRLRLFQFSLRDQASNWLERLPAGSITTWEDLTTRFLAQLFPPGRTAKLRNDILMFQQHHRESLSKAWTHVPSTSDRRLIELENQGQRLMEAHLAPTQPTQVNKITISCDICSGTHDTQYCMGDPEQAFVEYASSRTDEAEGEMTNKIDTVLKAITDQIAGTLPSDTVKNLKLGTHPVSSARSYPTVDPQCSSYPSTSINAIKAHFKEATIPQTSLQQPVVEIEPQQPEEPEPILEGEFQDLHLNLPVLEVLAHASIYNTILDKYIESLELGKNRLTFIQGEVPAKMEDPGLFTLPCRLRDSKPFDTLVDLGSYVNIIPLYLFKKLNIRLLEETDHIFGESYKPQPRLDGVGAQTPYYARKDFLDCHLPREWEIARDAELNPFKDTLVFRRMDRPPKDGDGAWHAKIRLIDLDGEEFTKTL
ncbi:MAK10-like protein, partial [Tanacetum coccineum]